MALSYLSGMEDNFLGIAEVGKPKRMTSQERASARQERYKAQLAKRRARIAARKARAAAERAALLIQQANATTKTAQALAMDEIGRRKKGGDGGGSARQEARAARRQAREERQQARQAIRKAKKEALQARRATIKAQRATKRAQAVAARTARAAARQEARAARRAAVPAPMLRRGRGAAAPAPEVEDIEAEIMDDEESDGGEESEMEAADDNEAIEGFLGMDEIGRRKKGGNRAAKKAARKTKRKEKRDKRGGSVAKKITLAPVRLALFALMKVNALKVRTKLRQAWKKDKNAVINKIVKRFGFKLDKFLTELNRKESEKLNGAEFGVAIETAIATATPAIIAITALLKQMGINPESMARVKGKGGTGAGEGEGGEEGTEDVPGKDEGTPGSNFRLSTPLLLGGAAIAAFLLLRKK